VGDRGIRSLRILFVAYALAGCAASGRAPPSARASEHVEPAVRREPLFRPGATCDEIERGLGAFLAAMPRDLPLAEMDEPRLASDGPGRFDSSVTKVGVMVKAKVRKEWRAPMAYAACDPEFSRYGHKDRLTVLVPT
jgi:hypothetical protein